MNSFDKITLYAFLVALIRLDSSLPVDLQQQLKEIGNRISQDTNISENIYALHLLTKAYSPLQQEYKLVRSSLQNDTERSRSTTVLEKNDDTSILSDEKLIGFAVETFYAEDSINFAKKAYIESRELKQFFSHLLPNVPCYKILSIVGKYCIKIQDGQKVYDLIHQELLSNRPIELDFTGVEICAPPFLNSAFGKLFQDIAPEQISRILLLSNLEALSSETLKLVIENSKHYYQDSYFRSRVDEVISEYANSF